uniref:Beta/gamma crystallin 'Greek key' domain-containing protein n=1 Tax=Latimeria chalumnae TaxID=7897 RepID=H3A4M4_LATCH
KVNPRPGKMVIYNGVQYGGNKQEIWTDVPDATSWDFPKGILIRIVRGCWMLYEKPDFQGQKHVLEEGETVLSHLWGINNVECSPRKVIIGSIKRVIKDHSIPEIELHPEADRKGTIFYIQNEVPNTEEYGAKLSLSSVIVNSGIWLAYKRPDFEGKFVVLEQGCPPLPKSGAEELDPVKSLRPLKMGGLKVQRPTNPKIIIYEQPFFTGWSMELTENAYNLKMLLDDSRQSQDEEFHGVGSVRVISGLWTAYEKEGYKGHQYLLEEGEYEDWKMWGGFDNGLFSLRYLQAEFTEPSVTLFEESSLENGNHLDTTQEIPDMESVGFGNVVGSIRVNSGVWVVYEQERFFGEQYVLERGVYKAHTDWGGKDKTIMSIRPIQLTEKSNHQKLKQLKAYSKPNFQGVCVDFIAEASINESFVPKSFQVLQGCWLLYSKEEFSGAQHVLEEGHYPDFTFSCWSTTIKSLKPVKYEFSEPSISLFAMDSCKGREVNFQSAVNSVLKKDFGFYTQSIRVKSGLWTMYEEDHFRGRQMLLEPGEIFYWTTFSGWRTVGSLHPVNQPTVFLRIKNRAQDLYLTAIGDLKDSEATQVSVSQKNRKDSQIWYYHRGLLKSKAANRACLSVIGGRDVPGSKVALWSEHGKAHQKWRINRDGTVSSYIGDDLVLDIKGGNYYDKDHIIINLLEHQQTQYWEVEIL